MKKKLFLVISVLLEIQLTRGTLDISRDLIYNAASSFDGGLTFNCDYNHFGGGSSFPKIINSRYDEGAGFELEDALDVQSIANENAAGHADMVSYDNVEGADFVAMNNFVDYASANGEEDDEVAVNIVGASLRDPKMAKKFTRQMFRSIAGMSANLYTPEGPRIFRKMYPKATPDATRAANLYGQGRGVGKSMPYRERNKISNLKQIKKMDKEKQQKLIDQVFVKKDPDRAKLTATIDTLPKEPTKAAEPSSQELIDKVFNTGKKTPPSSQ